MKKLKGLILGSLLINFSIATFAQEVGVNYFVGTGSMQNINGEVSDIDNIQDRYRFSNTQGVRVFYAQEMFEKFPITYFVSYQRSTFNFEFHLMEDVSFNQDYTSYNSYPILFSDEKGNDRPYEGVYTAQNGIHNMDYIFNTLSLGIGKTLNFKDSKLSITPSVHWLHSKINTSKQPNLVYSTTELEAPMQEYQVEFYTRAKKSFSDFRFNLSVNYKLIPRLDLSAFLELSTSGRRNRYIIARKEKREFENASGQTEEEVFQDQFFYSMRYINCGLGLKYQLFK